MIKRKEDIPETIWLQWANDEGEPLHPDEQTWCTDKIYAHDVRYVKPREKKTPDREQIMKQWDSWRAYIAEGGGGSWPRDAFEAVLDWYEEALSE